MATVEQQFVLRWHYHESTLLNNLPHLLESDFLTDITLSVGCQSVKAHRLVLASCSTYFLQLFQNMGPHQQPVVILQNTTYEDLTAIISFMYRGHCLITENQLPSILSVAKSLKIRGLCDMKVPEKKTEDGTTYAYKEMNNSSSSVEKQVDVQEMSKQNENSNRCNLNKVVESNTNNVDLSISTVNNNNVPEKDKTTQNASLPNASNNNKEESGKKIAYSDALPLDTDRPIADLEGHAMNGMQWKITKNIIGETSKCFICGKYLSNQYNLRVHMETHEEGYHACSSCPHVSRSRDALRKHVSYRHPGEYNARKRKKPDCS